MTSIETGPTWAERLNPRHWTLVWKLVIVGLVPAVLALTLGVLRITDQAGSAADFSRAAQLVDLHVRAAAAGDGLRQERDQATLYVAGNRAGDRGPVTAADAHSDETITAMRAAVTGAGTLDQSTSIAVAQAAGMLDQLESLRHDVTDAAVPLPTLRDRYTRVIEGVDVLDRAALRAVRVPDTAGQIDALTALQNVEAQLAVQHTVLGDAIRAGRLQDGDADAANHADVLIFAQYRAYQVALTPDQLQRYGSFLDDPSNADRQRLAIAILGAAGKPDLGGVTAGAWDNAYTAAKAVADRSADLIRQDLVAAGNTAAQQAGSRAGVNSVVLLLGLLLGITIAVLVARSLIRSLRVLRGAALDVAERRLPNAVESMRAGQSPDAAIEPVPIRSRDEVGQVARAFDAVHGQAVKLAAQQAALQTNVSAMFVNLSRRSQALVERQLQLIEALESNEQDADQLSNLFQLDHLATRMRRNSENLLVLAGTDLAKRNVAPVPMVDVLRAAVSEVEQYQRVVVQAPPVASIAGRAGSDLVHLLAELLDNATNFSPPDSQVIMSATRTPDAAMVVEISDRGVGMADHELHDANERLAGPTDVDVSASRRMGLFVVGRLAARHGVAVRLSSAAAGPGSGLTAWVTVPAALIPTGMPVEPARSSGAPMAAGAAAQKGAAQNSQGGEARIPRPEANGARSGSLSALATGADAGAATTSEEAAAAGGQGTSFAGRPPVNGAATNGLPTRRPGSSLRPEGPPPTSAPPGGFFDDSGRGGENRDRLRAPGEQARLDQEAAARRDQSTGDERSSDVDERSSRPDDGSADETGVRLPHDLAGPASAAPAERPVGPLGESAAEGLRPPPATMGPARGATAGPRRPQTGSPEDRASTPAAPPVGQARTTAPGSETATPADGTPRTTGGTADVEPSTDQRRAVERPAAGPTSLRTPPAEGEPTRFGGPARGADPTPRADGPGQAPQGSAVGSPSFPGLPATSGRPPAGGSGQPGERPAERTGSEPVEAPRGQDSTAADPLAPRPDPATAGQFRGDQQRGDQQRGDQQPTASAGWSTPVVGPRIPAGPSASDALTDRAPEELFAPRVPSLDPNGVLPGQDTGATPFDLGETTPIFEEIASAWFRSNRPVPVSWESDTGPHPTVSARTQDTETVDGAHEDDRPSVASPAEQPAVAAPEAEVPSAGSTSAESADTESADAESTGAESTSTATNAEPPAVAEPVEALDGDQDTPSTVVAPLRVPAARTILDDPFDGEVAVPAARTPAADFASAADAGWLAASSATDRADEVTSAGLPKRRPRARLIPGSAGSAVLAPAVPGTRSAETIRGRLASYQQGVRQGRETRLRGLDPADHPAPPATADADHDEESP